MSKRAKIYRYAFTLLFSRTTVEIRHLDIACENWQNYGWFGADRVRYCCSVNERSTGIQDMVARKFMVSGRVQGVGYRYFAQRVAARHQVRGYVRNLEDGRVEAMAQGDERAVALFGQELAAGPDYSKVDKIEETVVEPDNSFSSFRIER